MDSYKIREIERKQLKMALKILQLRNKLDLAQKSLAELVRKDADFVTRSADLEARIPECRDAESQAACDADIEAYEAEKTAHEEAKASLGREIEGLEAELAELDKPVDEEKVETVHEERGIRPMEIRNTPEYINAYAEYIKSGDDHEVRALLSENSTVTTGTVPVPELVYDIVKTAWEKEGIMSLVRKAYLRGNLKVGFEISADGAVIHAQEGSAVTEEALSLGVVELVPQSIKKWISVSDEALDMRGEAFLRYIYDELAYRIAKKAADQIIAKIEAAATATTTGGVGVPKVTATSIALGTIAAALGQLSDEAANPVIMMNKQTWSAFKAVQAAGSYGYDPFEGLPVLFNNTITAYSAATTGVTYAIVGDLGHGALANFPNGEEITIKYDDMSLAEKDLVKIVAREYVGLGIVAPNAFVKITH